ncbi:MAG TPA: hypothetical protein VLI42_09545 [Chthoniobacterales bacterium]|nr:hypothetical protein [Chthoniobacterales bacterium]
MKRYDQNASVIFDRDEPIGRATDLILPDRRWFNRRARRKLVRTVDSAPEHS